MKNTSHAQLATTEPAVKGIEGSAGARWPARSIGATPSRVPIEYRTLQYQDVAEVRAYITLLYAISAQGDAYHFKKSPEFIDRAVIKARREENESNTFAGLALTRAEIVGVHLLRRIEEGPRVGAQVAGLWVAERWRRQGIARRLKLAGESWARGIGAEFINSNVLIDNHAMLSLNRALGFADYRINLRKRL